MEDLTVLVLSDPTEPHLAMLEALPEKTSIAVGNTPEAFERTAATADILFNWSAQLPVFEQVWKMSPRVRWVHVRSAGLDGVLFPALVESPVPMTNGRGVFSDALGEFALGAVFYFAKNFRRLIQSQTAGVWDRFDTVEVRGQTMGVLGYGDVGRACAQRAHAIGMKVLALRRRPGISAGDPIVDQVFTPDRKLEFLARCDYVVATLPLTEESRGLIGAPEIGVMKPSAALINIGRGPVVDEHALIDALERKRILGAALDVYNTEPLPAGHPFYKLDNVLLSPHCADHTPDWQQRGMQLFLENFERFRRGQPLANVVNKKRGY